MADFFRSTGVPLRLSLPARPNRSTPVVVSVHGVSRNSAEHLEQMRAALRDDVAIVAPHFDAGAFPHYQRLGLGFAERRADLWLDASLAALAVETDLETTRFHLFGFSGGAQFAHRYALLNPGRVRAMQLAAAGYYTYLDENVPWPRGLSRAPLGGQMSLNRNFFLRIPIDIYVGDEDTDRDPALRKGRAIDAQQGPDRRSRAVAWCTHLRGLQAKLGLAPAGVTVLDRVGHDFDLACDVGCIGHRVAQRFGLAKTADKQVEPHALGLK
jgi:pimeloyl-ACP methyl ester carboxylesterase